MSVNANELGAEGLNPADRELEAALMALKPAAPVIDSADALFEAGRRAAAGSAHRQLILWRSAAALLVVALAGSLLLRSASPRIEPDRIAGVAPAPAPDRNATAPEPSAPAPLPPLPKESMLALRQVALERGVDHLPASPGARVGLTRIRDLAIP